MAEDMNDLIRRGAGRQPAVGDAAPRPAPSDGGAREHSTPPRQPNMNALIRNAARAAEMSPSQSVVFAGPLRRVNVAKAEEGKQ